MSIQGKGISRKDEASGGDNDREGNKKGPPYAATPSSLSPTSSLSSSLQSTIKSQLSSSTKVVRNVLNDYSKIKSDSATLEYFPMMRSDVVPLHGLQDWPKLRWIREMQTCSPSELSILDTFLSSAENKENDSKSSQLSRTPIDQTSEEDVAIAVAEIKDRIAGPLLERDWILILKFQNERMNHAMRCAITAAAASLQSGAKISPGYIEDALCSTALFRREFPLGVSDHIYENERKGLKFALYNSGLSKTVHSKNSAVNCLLYTSLFGIVIGGIAFLLMYMAGSPDLWDFVEGTVQDTSDPLYSEKLNQRTKDRGTVASILASLTFSLSVNASMDAIGKIDPSTSTVMIGMLLGNSFGFVLDNMLGSDEGFREYKWNTLDGMQYGIGSLGTSRFARYMITIVFDMFFTVILFKLFYSRIVRLAGFSAHGREWLANGFCSFFISFLTYQVYANMTRFEWAYPSGVEDLRNQWISGQSMILYTVTMNIVFLIAETRTKFKEPGINDPNVKLLLTIVTFLSLFGLQVFGVVDPSVLENVNVTTPIDPFDVHRPLPNVCYTKALVYRGAAVLSLIVFGSIGFVVFATSRQTLSELRRKCLCCCGTGDGSLRKVTPTSDTADGSKTNRNSPRVDQSDLWRGKIALFILFGSLTFFIVTFFAFVPFYSTDETRRTAGWKDVCDRGDYYELRDMGL